LEKTTLNDEESVVGKHLVTALSKFLSLFASWFKPCI